MLWGLVIYCWKIYQSSVGTLSQLISDSVRRFGQWLLKWLIGMGQSWKYARFYVFHERTNTHFLVLILKYIPYKMFSCKESLNSCYLNPAKQIQGFFSKSLKRFPSFLYLPTLNSRVWSENSSLNFFIGILQGRFFCFYGLHDLEALSQ